MPIRKHRSEAPLPAMTPSLWVFPLRSLFSGTTGIRRRLAKESVLPPNFGLLCRHLKGWAGPIQLIVWKSFQDERKPQISKQYTVKQHWGLKIVCGNIHLFYLAVFSREYNMVGGKMLWEMGRGALPFFPHILMQLLKIILKLKNHKVRIVKRTAWCIFTNWIFSYNQHLDNESAQPQTPGPPHALFQSAPTTSGNHYPYPCAVNFLWAWVLLQYKISKEKPPQSKDSIYLSKTQTI